MPSANQRSPPDRSVVDQSTSGRSNIALATIAPTMAPATWATM